MRYIDLSKINTEDSRFQAWQRKAEEKNAEIQTISSHKGRSDYFDRNPHWREIKPILKDTYGNICWYSGSDLSNSVGDIDHYRPKNESKDLDGTTILSDGYWWLAYDYTNYRLSCVVSNSRFEGGGKRNYFPLRDASRAGSQDSTCENEEPLLLDPCKKHDTELVGYLDNGEVIALSKDPWQEKRVKKSVELYNLNRFNAARRLVIEGCQTTLEAFEMAYEQSNSEKMIKYAKHIRNLANEKSPYSSVARYFLEQGIEGKEYERDLRRIICSAEYELTGAQT